MTLFSIGEFSRASGLTVKTLRFYHEKQLLVPAHIERETGYRNYDKQNLERARVIVALRGLGFGLDAIAAILAECREATGAWGTAAGCYHSRDPQRAAAYAARVARYREGLQ